MYGDNYWKIEFNKMIDFANTKNSKVFTTVYNNVDGSGEYGSKIIFILMIKV